MMAGFAKITSKVWALALLASLSCGAPASDSGTVILVGGVLSLKEPVVWQRISELAGDAVVISAAKARAKLYGTYAARGLSRAGLFAEVLPIATAPTEFGLDYRQAVRDPKLVAQVQDADAVFFVGGAPQNLSSVLFEMDGSATPLALAVRQVHADGGVIIGGIPGHIGAHTGIEARPTLIQGRLPAQHQYRGLGLVPAHWYVDQHFLRAGRFAEALVTMSQHGLRYGVGVGPNAAAVITGDALEVVGNGGVVIVDLSQATTQVDSGFRLQGAKLSYLDNGDRVHLSNAQVIPHPDKLAGFEIDPNSSDDQSPLQDGPLPNDVLTGNRLVELMLSALEGESKQTVGFDFPKGQGSLDKGFRFGLYPGQDTIGWLNMDESGAHHTTALNMYLDVTPLTRREVGDRASQKNTLKPGGT